MLIAVARDAADNTTQSTSINVTAFNDLLPPVLSSVTAIPGTERAVIAWVTNEPSNTRVAFGTNAAYGSFTSLDSTMVTQHSVTISGLKAGALYYYQAISSDASGNVGRSGGSTVRINKKRG